MVVVEEVLSKVPVQILLQSAEVVEMVEVVPLATLLPAIIMVVKTLAVAAVLVVMPPVLIQEILIMVQGLECLEEEVDLVSSSFHILSDDL